MKEFCREFTVGKSGEHRTDCPECKGSQKDTLSVNADTGVFHCYRCDTSGNFKAGNRKDFQKMPLPDFIIDRADPLNGNGHPYLINKGVSACPNLYVSTHEKYAGTLIIPVFDVAGNVRTLSFVTPDGQKTFLSNKDGRHPKKGHYFSIGTAAEVLYLCEGLATGLSVYEATRSGVVVCFDADNLLPVAKNLREKLPDTTFVFCADNDEHGKGHRKACEAAGAVDGRVAMPDETGYDFNDLHKEKGAEAVSEAIAKAQVPEAITKTSEPAPAEIPKNFETDLIEKTSEVPGTPFTSENLEILREFKKNDLPRWINLRERLKQLKCFKISDLDRLLPDTGDNDQNITDLECSRRFTEENGQDIRFCFERDKWFVWDGKKWVADERGEVVQRSKAVVSELPKNQSKRSIFDIITLAKSDLPVSYLDFDSNPHLVNLENGIFNLETGELSPHDRDALQSQIAGTGYSPGDSCPLWEKSLKDWFDDDSEMCDFIQRAVGYSLFGGNPEHDLFICHGNGGNGKSVFLNVLSALLGDYAQTTPMETFLAKRNEATNDLAALAKARLVIAGETEEDSALSTARVKSMTGGDPISCRFLFKEYFTYTPEFTVWLAVNHKPVIKNQDRGIWRRVKLLPFENEIPDEDMDKQLEDKLMAELPGIMAWAVSGWAEYQKNGLGYPKKVLQATSEYQSQQDYIGEFLENCCVIADGSRVKQTELYAAYVTFCENFKERPLGKKKFYDLLRQKGFTEKKNGVKFWVGIGLLVPDEQNGQNDSTRQNVSGNNSARFQPTEIKSEKDCESGDGWNGLKKVEPSPMDETYMPEKGKVSETQPDCFDCENFSILRHSCSANRTEGVALEKCGGRHFVLKAEIELARRFHFEEEVA